jgi:hypothetical protein
MALWLVSAGRQGEHVRRSLDTSRIWESQTNPFS